MSRPCSYATLTFVLTVGLLIAGTTLNPSTPPPTNAIFKALSTLRGINEHKQTATDALDQLAEVSNTLAAISHADQELREEIETIQSDYDFTQSQLSLCKEEHAHAIQAAHSELRATQEALQAARNENRELRERLQRLEDENSDLRTSITLIESQQAPLAIDEHI
jgi:chromosome segregation ATPase